jgi:TolB-like protein/Tfp pilus assembly protein PilF
VADRRFFAYFFTSVGREQDVDEVVPRVLQFDRFVLDLARGCLRQDDRELELRPKAFKVLCHLAERAGHLVAKEELYKAVWNDITVSDDSLVQCIRQLRHALGDEQHRLIKTVARRGYLLDVRVSQHVSGLGTTVPAGPLALPDKPSIAVLPFINLSGDPEQEYFADGVVEDIITALSRIKWLFVIARHSSFAYKGRSIDVKQVGRELAVRYVLEGSIRRAAGRVRITGQLIDAETGAHLWADRFEGGADDIFELQDQVTARIVALLTPRLELAEIERARRKPTDNLDAYDYYLRGRASIDLRTRASIDDALSLFDRAIALDPNFATAYGTATFCYVLRKAGGWVSNRQHDIAETDRLARRAWELDRDDAVALGFAGYALAFVVGDLSTGAAYVERALTLNPGYAPTLLISGWIHIWLGQPDVAIDHVQRALRLNPLGPHTAGMQMVTALAHYIAGRYDEAYLWVSKALHERPDSAPYLRLGAASAAMSGNPAEAARHCARLQRIDPGLRVSTLGETQGPFRESEYLCRFAEGLRLAGLPK